jgi:Fe-S cluster assembly iron-binding protein IscA
MLEVTDKAKAELKNILDARNLDPGQCLRLVTPPMWDGEGDFGIVIANQGAHDYAIVYEDTDVLVIDAGLMDGLQKAVFDYKDTPQGKGFTLDVY